MVVRKRKDVSYSIYEIYRETKQYEIIERAIEVLMEDDDLFLEKFSEFDKEYTSNEPRRKNRHISKNREHLPTGEKIQKGEYWFPANFPSGRKKKLIQYMCEFADVNFQHKRVPDKLI